MGLGGGLGGRKYQFLGLEEVWEAVVAIPGYEGGQGGGVVLHLPLIWARVFFRYLGPQCCPF